MIKTNFTPSLNTWVFLH